MVIEGRERGRMQVADSQQVGIGLAWVVVAFGVAPAGAGTR